MPATMIFVHDLQDPIPMSRVAELLTELAIAVKSLYMGD